MSTKLESKVAVITGGNSGIGLATARLFVSEGAKVVITGRNQETINTAVSELGSSVLGLQVDVTNIEESGKVYEKTREKFGKIDILFLNAGIAPFSPIEYSTEADFDTIFNINVKGPFFNIQKAIPHLNKGASIILTTSAVDQKGFPNSSIYSASKAAIRSFVRVLAAELQDKNIRVNAIAPGPIETPIFARMELTDEQMSQMKAQFTQMVPLQRFGTAQEVAKGVLYLAIDATYSTGSELMVDGGISQV